VLPASFTVFTVETPITSICIPLLTAFAVIAFAAVSVTTTAVTSVCVCRGIAVYSIASIFPIMVY